MKRFEIEKESYIKITCTNGFMVEGYNYNDYLERFGDLENDNI